MTRGHFCHFQAPIQASRGPKIANQDQLTGMSPVQNGPPGKCLVRHITSQWMRQHDLGPFLPFPGTYPGVLTNWQGLAKYYLGPFMPSRGTFMAPRLQKHEYIWQPWFSPTLSTFRCLEVSEIFFSGSPRKTTIETTR